MNTVKAYAELDGRPRLEVTVWECEGEGPVEIPEEGSWELQRDLAECDEYAPVREALDAIGCHTITHKDEGGRTILKTYAPHEGGLSFDMGEEVKPAVITFEIEGEVLTEGQLQGRYVEAMEKCIRGEAWSELETIAVAMWVEYVHAQHKAGAMMDRLEGAPDREAYDKEVEAVFPDKGGESKATKAKQKATKPGRVDRRNLFA